MALQKETRRDVDEKYLRGLFVLDPKYDMKKAKRKKCELLHEVER